MVVCHNMVPVDRVEATTTFSLLVFNKVAMFWGPYSISDVWHLYRNVSIYVTKVAAKQKSGELNLLCDSILKTQSPEKAEKTSH